MGTYVTKQANDSAADHDDAVVLPPASTTVELKRSERYNIFPIRDKESWDFYTSQKTQMWDPCEIEFREDIRNFSRMKSRHQRLVRDLLAFFAPGDGIVIEMVDVFMTEAENLEQEFFYKFQSANEATHAEGYGLCIKALFNEREQAEILREVDTVPCVAAKAAFMEKYTDKKIPLGIRLIAGAASEGIFFVGLFTIIFYLRSLASTSDNSSCNLRSFIFLNEQVAKDEFLHRDFNIMRARRLRDQYTREEAVGVLSEALNIEIEHIKYILREPVESPEIDAVKRITVENISKYVAGLADQIMVGLGFGTEFTTPVASIPGKYVEISLPWMNDMSLTKKTNFYEGKVASYRLSPHVGGDGDEQEFF